MDSRPSLTSSWPQSSYRPILLPFPRDLWEWSLHDVPGILGCVAELAAGDAGREAIVADGDLLIHILVGEVVRAFGHGSDEDADALVSAQGVDVVSDANDIRLEAQRHLPAVRRQVVGDGVLDDTEELLLRVSGSDGQPVQELHHQAGEALESARDADRGRHLNELALGCLDIDLQLARLVDGRVQQREQTLSRVSARASVSAAKRIRCRAS